MSVMLEEVLDGLCDRIGRIERLHGNISSLMRERLANEKMLQLEVMRLVSLMKGVDDYLVEKPYGHGVGEKCDLWFKESGTEYWMEIKMRPTNYRKAAHHSKAFSRGIDSAITDFERLKEWVSPPAHRLGLFAFYPLYPESWGIFKRYHLSRLSNAVGRDIVGPSKRIQVGDANFDIYLVEV
jgi:hypothetical protein